MAEDRKDVYDAFERWKTADPKLEAVYDGEQFVPHHNADGTLKHYCTASYCPDLHGRTS